MRTVIVLIFLSGLLSIGTHAQNFRVSAIPDSLTENAHAVVREFLTEINLEEVNKGVFHYRKVITVLDNQGDDEAILTVGYDKNSVVKIKNALIYNGTGALIRKMKQSDIIDVPCREESVLFSDNRKKVFIPEPGLYPYTVEYEYEVHSTNLLSYGGWMVVDGYNISLEHAGLVLSYPEEYSVNRKELNIPHGQKGIRNNLAIETWEVNSFRALEEEPFSPDIDESVPTVLLMPSELHYDDYSGSAATWGEYGSWVNKLLIGRDELSDAEKARVNALLKNKNDTLERIRTLYKYMQQNTRYVGIKLGLGGYQPFDAKTVNENGYGDCKALSNYLCSLLKYSGIRSFPALIASGKSSVPVYHDFPNFLQFNHEIVCVPNHRDTIWLECTNQNFPFGFLSEQTDDRDVLLITENGGKFAHTRKYSAVDNLRTGTTKLSIDSAGTAGCTSVVCYKGLQYEDIFDFLYSNYNEQKKWLAKNTDLPSAQILNFTIEEYKGPLPSAVINESISSRNYGTFTGNYMVLPLNKVNTEPPLRKMLKSRKSDVLISRSSLDIDTLIFQIPRNYKIETLPLDQVFETSFGEYAFSVKAEGNEIICIRKFLVREGRFKPSAYKDLYDFILGVSKADNTKVLLAKKQ